MFPKPLRDNGKKETSIAYDAKRLWAITKFNDTYNEITFDYFLHHFEEMIKKASFEWKHNTYPNPNTAKDWPGKYDWKGCCKHYEDYKLGKSKNDADLIYNKKYLSDTIDDFKLIDTLKDRIRTLQTEEQLTGQDNTYRIAKLEEMIDSIWHRIRERLGKDKEEPTSNETITVPVNPEHEDQTIRDIWTERARNDVIPR